MRHLVLFTIAIMTFCPISVVGQFYNTDPYLIEFSNLDIEHSKDDVISNRIKKISCIEYELKKDGSRKKNPQEIYTLVLDEYGNPLQFHSVYLMEIWWLPKLKSKLGISERPKTTYDYNFEYDNLHNLIHAKETIVDSNSSHYEENDIYNSFNSDNRLSHQLVSQKSIYPSGYTYRGQLYENDTVKMDFTFSYIGAILEKVVVSGNGDKGQVNSNVRDTLLFNCSADSMFMQKELSRGIKLDSLGRVIERTFYARYAVPAFGGPPIINDSPGDVIQKYFYNENGKLIKIEDYFRRGDFLSRLNITYDPNGLLSSSQYQNSKFITVYEYERY